MNGTPEEIPEGPQAERRRTLRPTDNVSRRDPRVPGPAAARTLSLKRRQCREITYKSQGIAGVTATTRGRDTEPEFLGAVRWIIRLNQ